MRMVKNIQGTWSSDAHVVAFCAYNGHKGYLTKGQRKKHGCLKRHCRYYVSLKKIKTDRDKKCEKEG